MHAVCQPNVPQLGLRTIVGDKLEAGLKKRGDLPLNFLKESGLIMHPGK